MPLSNSKILEKSIKPYEHIRFIHLVSSSFWDAEFIMFVAGKVTRSLCVRYFRGATSIYHPVARAAHTINLNVNMGISRQSETLQFTKLDNENVVVSRLDERNKLLKIDSLVLKDDFPFLDSLLSLGNKDVRKLLDGYKLLELSQLSLTTSLQVRLRSHAHIIKHQTY